jgi:P-type Cu2+ transporter
MVAHGINPPLASARAPVRSRPRRASCLHCATPLPAGLLEEFCCRGCEEVNRLVTQAGLGRYYELGGGEGHPVAGPAAARADHKWLEPIAARLGETRGLSRVVLDVQGVHCAACVWLFDELFRREPGAAGILVNPAVGTVELTVAREFPLASYVAGVEAFGYRMGPPLKGAREERAAGDSIVWRMGVCIAIAMNTMIFAIALYAGLDRGPVYELFHGLDFALSFVSVLVGGTVFFRSAWQALKQRVLHLDLPIALGILLAFASSTYTYFTRGGATSYFDTLNVFIALMLVGRFLQERVLAKNRALLLASDGAEGIYTRRVEEGRVDLVRCTEIEEGDLLLVGHQDLVPVDAELVSTSPSVFSLDWISGESAPKAFSPGDVVPAGAFCQDARAATVRATAPFDASSIVALLRTETRRDHDLARATPWWKRLTRIYVGAVLAVAGLGFAGWYGATLDLGRTLDVVAAVLIVTCPCAFGIATPLAYELAQAGLRRVGLFVRTPGFLDRAVSIDRVVFDKTGTLTTGALVVRSAAALDALSPEDRRRLGEMAARSSHPKSRAIALALEARGEAPGFDPSLTVTEVPGCGLEMRSGGDMYRLGSASFAAPDGAILGEDVVFTKNGEPLASLTIGEELRPDAREEVLALAASGVTPYVLSGDSAQATRAMAVASGIPETRAVGGQSPEGKAAWLRASGNQQTLFIGDGLNDSLVAEEALCAGTPAIDRPFMASRCDFYFVTPGLRPIRAALTVARRLASVVRTNLVIAVLYNAVTVPLALAGLMTPLLCAIVMPLSSLSAVLATTAQLGQKRTAWKS